MTSTVLKNSAPKSVSSDGAIWWWLRSPGYASTEAATVSVFGMISKGGKKMSLPEGGVRPALWLKTDISFTADQTDDDFDAPQPLVNLLSRADSLEKGHTVVFGHYEQDNNSENGPEPIEWLVLSVQKHNILLISRYGLDVKQYHNYKINTNWEMSRIRYWLNGEFLGAAFSQSEMNMIQRTAVKNSIYGQQAGSSTIDRVFLLNVTEAGQFFDSDRLRICIPTAYALAKSSYQRLENVSWWLLSQGADSVSAAFVSEIGKINKSGADVDALNIFIRPVIRVNTNQK